MKKSYIYVNYKNIIVLQTYLEIIGEAIRNLGYEVSFVKDLSGVNKEDLIVFPMGIDAFKFYFKGYHKFIIWQQGATADESFMRNHSRIRYWMLNKIDTFVMKKAKAVLFVSQYMKDHYENLANRSFISKSYIMPCFNEVFESTVYDNKDYSNKTFTYVGSLDLWQCFEQTVILYKQIEDAVPEAYFKVLTFDTENAERIIKEKGIRHYSVKCVPKEEVRNELESVNYGFVIREDNMVNRVATPTKISSYMAAGVIPIFSTCLKDFCSFSRNLKYVKAVENIENECIDEVIDFVKNPIDLAEIRLEYKKVFDTYYSKKTHCQNLVSLLKEVL